MGAKPVLEAPPAPPTPCFAPLRDPHRWLMHFHFTHRLSPPPPVPTGTGGLQARVLFAFLTAGAELYD